MVLGNIFSALGYFPLNAYNFNTHVGIMPNMPCRYTLAKIIIQTAKQVSGSV